MQLYVKIPNSYTVVGEPIIDQDGVASNFSSTNYITRSINSFNASQIKIRLEFNLNNTTYSGSANNSILEVYSTNGNIKLLSICINSTNKILLSQDSSFGIENFKEITPVDKTVNAILELTLNKTTDIISYNYYENNILLTQGTTSSTADWSVNSIYYLGYKTGSFQGSINLSQFEILADNITICKFYNLFYAIDAPGLEEGEEILIDANTYLPEFLSANDRILTITELYNLLISNKSEIFEDIKETYQDGIYKIKNYNKLSHQAKLEVINELGFSYITDILELSNDKLTQLLTFFNLIYCLKGKDEGLNLVLNMLQFPYTYIPWYVVSTSKGTVSTYNNLPKNPSVGDTYQVTDTGSYYMYNNLNWQLIKNPSEYATQRTEFTCDLQFHSELSNEQFTNLKKFLRAYMLPWINCSADYEAINTDFYAWGGPGVLTKIIYSTVFNVSVDI